MILESDVRQTIEDALGTADAQAFGGIQYLEQRLRQGQQLTPEAKAELQRLKVKRAAINKAQGALRAVVGTRIESQFTEDTSEWTELRLAINAAIVEMGAFDFPLDDSLQGITWQRWQLERARRIEAVARAHLSVKP